jgi:hypothetical protein
MTAAVLPSSAAGLLTLLADDNDELKHYALVHLNNVVHEFWFQIASYIGSVEALYEDDEFKDRELAALIASKVWGLCLLGGAHATQTCMCSSCYKASVYDDEQIK